MKILVATDKFKGSMTGPEACRAIANGIRAASTSTDDFTIQTLPIADGGEGITEALVSAHGGSWFECEVKGPLGNIVTARYGLIKNDTAVIEMAEASGLHKLGAATNDPWLASTYGTGQLIRHAIDQGAKSIVLGIGGSATNDGGTGMARALGYRFFDQQGNELTTLPEQLEQATKIEFPDRADFPVVTVACDVTNPLLGENGCTPIYGPQKGIVPEQFKKHEARLQQLVQLTESSSKADLPGAGAAGGLGFGAMVFLNATLEPGFDLVAEKLQLEKAIQSADLVITGEGKIDDQSMQGKAPAGMAQLAQTFSKPVIAFCGLADGDETVFKPLFEEIITIDRGDLSVEQSMQNGQALLESTAKNWAERFFQ